MLNFLLFMSQYVALWEACLGQASSATWTLALHLYNEETKDIILVFDPSYKRPSTSE